MVLLNDLNQTKDIAKTFSFLAEIFKNPYNEKIIRNRDSYLYNSRCFMTVMSTMMSYLIGYSYEQCKNYDEQLIDKVLNQFSFWKTIKFNGEISVTEKFKQFRNCFEHANFLLCYDDSVQMDENKNYYIEDLTQIRYHFKNDTIEGEIDFIEFVQLYDKCVDLFTKYNRDNKIAMYILDDRVKIPNYVRNSKDLETILSGVLTRDISASFNPLSDKVNISIDDRQFVGFAYYGSAKKNYEWNPNTVYNDPTGSMLNTPRTRYFILNKVALGMNQINIVSRRLTEEEKEKIRKHIIFVTNNFKKPYTLTDDFIHQVFNNTTICYKAKDVILSVFYDFIVRCYEKNTQAYIRRFKQYSLSDLQKRITDDFGTTQQIDDIIALAPGLYLTSIISSANYFLNYTFEVNKKMDSNIFRYTGIDLSEIEIENLSDDKLIKITDPMLQENTRIASLQRQLDDMPQKLEWSKKQIIILNNPNNKDPNKTTKLQNIMDFVNNYDQKREEIKKEISMLIDYVNKDPNNKPYQDAYHLFRHLRNSISHGRFKVNFEPGYKKNDLGESIIEFYDIDDDKEDDIRNASIKVKMTLNRFEKLIKNLSDIVCTQMKEEQFEQITRRIAGLDDKSEDAKNKYNRKAGN